MSRRIFIVSSLFCCDNEMVCVNIYVCVKVVTPSGAQISFLVVLQGPDAVAGIEIGSVTCKARVLSYVQSF